MASSGSFPSAPLPLNCNCLPAVVEPSLRTTTGRRCQVMCCIEVVAGAHFSQSVFCSLRSDTPILDFVTQPERPLNLRTEPPITNSSAPISHPFFVSAPSHQLNFAQVNMPCLRQRMRCRRGSRRGKILHTPSSSLSDSSSPSSAQFTGRYPATRRDRGQARTASTRFDDAATQSPDTFASPLQPNQYYQFHFRCTLDSPCIIAKIYVAFREESQNSEEFAHTTLNRTGSVQETNIASKQGSLGTIRGSTQEAVMKRKAPGSRDEQDNGSSDDQGCTKLGCFKNKEDNPGDKQDAEDDVDAYRCPIVEEPLSPPNDT